MIPPCLCNSWGIGSNANLGPNMAWVTKAGVLLPWRCFPPWHIQIPITHYGFLHQTPLCAPSWSRAPRKGRQESGTGGTHRKRGKNERKSIFFWAPPRKLVWSWKELIAVKACQSPDSQLQSPGTNVIIANKLKSLTVMIASGKTPTGGVGGKTSDRRGRKKN